MTPILKKTIWLCFILLSTQLHAQNFFGVRAGANFASVNIKADGLSVTPDRIFGLDFALFGEFGVGSNIAIQSELHFLQKGWRQKVEFFGNLSDISIKFNYLEIPILLKYKFGNESITGFVLLGPSIGYALSGKTKDHINELEEDLEFEDDDGFRRTAFGLAIGAGIGIPAGSGQFIVDFRYLIGLSDLDDDPDTTEKIKHRSLNLTIGYAFPISGSKEK